MAANDLYFFALDGPGWRKGRKGRIAPDPRELNDWFHEHRPKWKVTVFFEKGRNFPNFGAEDELVKELHWIDRHAIVFCRLASLNKVAMRLWSEYRHLGILSIVVTATPEDVPLEAALEGLGVIDGLPSLNAGVHLLYKGEIRPAAEALYSAAKDQLIGMSEL